MWDRNIRQAAKEHSDGKRNVAAFCSRLDSELRYAEHTTKWLGQISGNDPE